AYDRALPAVVRAVEDRSWAARSEAGPVHTPSMRAGARIVEGPRAVRKIVDTGSAFAYSSPPHMTPDVVAPELLEIPSPQERRGLAPDLCASLLDRLLRRLARQEALCRRVLGRLAHHFLSKRAHQRLGFVRLDDFARERLGLSGRELQELARVAQRLEALPA